MRFPQVSIDRLNNIRNSMMHKFKALRWVKYIQKRYTFDGNPCDPKQTQKLQEHLAGKPANRNLILKLLGVSLGLGVLGMVVYAKVYEIDKVPVDKDFKGADYIDLASIKK